MIHHSVTKATQKRVERFQRRNKIKQALISPFSAKNFDAWNDVSLTVGWFPPLSPPAASEPWRYTASLMKKDIHPKYNPVVFVDMTTGKRFITRSTKTSDKKEVIDGVEHSVISIGITSDSHPFFTGLAQCVDTEGRIDKFQKRFGAVRRVGKPKVD
jgi:large subunit ribosomal protein L31